MLGARISLYGRFYQPSVRMRSKGLQYLVCVCVSVTQHLTLYVIIRATNDSNLLSGG